MRERKPTRRHAAVPRRVREAEANRIAVVDATHEVALHTKKEHANSGNQALVSCKTAFMLAKSLRTLEN